MINLKLLPILCLVGALISICGVALADDGAVQDVSGGTVQPMDEHPSIQMVSESVDIKLGKKVGWEWPVFVRCQFFLKNDGPATDVLIGFPEHAHAGGDAELSPTDRLIGFKSWVDGKPVKVKYMPSSKNKKSDNQQEDYKAWYVKKVHFDAGQTRRVVDVYSARLGFAAEVMTTTSSILTYVLCSGASWKGPIGSAVIRADLSEAMNDYDIAASPEGYIEKGNVLNWNFKNLNPKEDISILLIPKLPLLNGTKIGPICEPFFRRNGDIMVSPVFLLGEEVKISDMRKNRRVIHHGCHTLILTAGSKSATLDNKKITLKTAPWGHKITEDFAIPLEETIKLLGGKVKYDANHRANVILKN